MRFEPKDLYKLVLLSTLNMKLITYTEILIN